MGLINRVVDTRGGLRGEVLLRICCILSRIPMVFDGWRGIVKDVLYRVAYTKGVLREERYC